MRCTQCAAVSYSAAARTLVAQGERCSQCGGEVELVPVEAHRKVPVTPSGKPAPEGAPRRFERDR